MRPSLDRDDWTLVLQALVLSTLNLPEDSELVLASKDLFRKICVVAAIDPHTVVDAMRRALPQHHTLQ